VAIAKSDGTPLEYVRYSSYGEPTVYPVADIDMNGKVDAADNTEWAEVYGGNGTTTAYTADLDFDGKVDSDDDDLFSESYAANSGLSGKGRLSSPGVGNRIGYAGYQWDPASRLYDVRHRWYFPEIGRWGRRDPLGYADGNSLYEYVRAAVILDSDPSGLIGHDGIEFVNPPTWTPGLKKRVEDSIWRIERRARNLLAQIKALKGTLSSCVLKALEAQLAMAETALSCLGNSEQGSGYGELHFTQRDIGGDEATTLRKRYWLPRIKDFLDSECSNVYYVITLDTSENGNWSGRSDDALDTSIMHELTHVCEGSGANKDDTKDLDDPHLVDDLLTTDISSWTELNWKIQQAQRECGEFKRKPAAPRNPG